MTDITCVDKTYSTTRLLTQEKPAIENKPEDKFESVLFFPAGEGRQSEGGLRTQGYFKTSLPDKPLITIVTVVFNGDKFLEETIQSVINQTYDNVEYIIIDGGSTDGTLDIIRQYEHAIDYWVSERDGGIYDAMNKGWALSMDFTRILFLGAGDIIRTMPTAAEILENSDKIIYGVVALHDRIFKSISNWRLKLGNTLHHQALLVPKKHHKSPPFDLAFRVYADYDFNLRLYMKGVEFVFSPSFESYALPDGISAKLDIAEMSRVSRNNCGLFWGVASWIYCFIKSKKALLNEFL